MYSAILALIISLVMIAMVIFKGRMEYYIVLCKKAELAAFIDNLPDDALIQIRIGRNSYEHSRSDLPRR